MPCTNKMATRAKYFADWSTSTSLFCALEPTKHLYFVSIIYAHCLLATLYGRLYYILFTVAGFGTFSVEYYEYVVIYKNIKGKTQIYNRYMFSSLIRALRHSSIIVDKEVIGVVLSFLIVGIIYRKEALLHGPK